MKISLYIFLAATAFIAASALAQVHQQFPSADGRVNRNAMLVVDGVLYIGGDFGRVAGQKRHRLAAIDLASNQLLDWDPRLGGDDKDAVCAIAEMDGLIYVGGSFKTAQGKPCERLVAVTPAGQGPASVLDWAPNPDGTVLDLLAGPGGRLFVAGRFENIAGQARVRLASLRAASAGPPQADAFAPVMDRWVGSLVADPHGGPHVVAAGGFLKVNGKSHPLLARLNSQTGAVEGEAFQFEGGKNPQLLKLVSANGLVYAAGVEIDRVNGHERKNLFSFQPASGKIMPFRADLNAGAGALAVVRDHLFVGGDFTLVNNSPARLAHLDAFSGEIRPLSVSPDHNTYALALWGQSLFLSGYWKNLQGQAGVDYLARADSGVAGGALARAGGL